MLYKEKREWLKKHGTMRYGAPSFRSGRLYCHWMSGNHTVVTMFGESKETTTCMVFAKVKENLFNRCK